MTKRRSRRPLRLFWSSFGHLGLVIDWSLGVKGPRWSLIERQWPPVSCPLPPVPCLLSPAPLPPDSRPLIPQPRPSLSAENLKELLQSAGASRVFARVKQPLPGPIQIELEQEPDAMGAALLVANGVDAIPVAHRPLPNANVRVVRVHQDIRPPRSRRCRSLTNVVSHPGARCNCPPAGRTSDC